MGELTQALVASGGVIMPVDRLDIVRPPVDTFEDGFPTYVLVDGKKLPDRDPPLWDKRVLLVVEAGANLSVAVWVTDKTIVDGQYNEQLLIFQPKDFDLTLGCVRVRTHPTRYPCQITINGFEPRVKALTISFEEGVAVWVNMEFLPIGEMVPDDCWTRER